MKRTFLILGVLAVVSSAAYINFATAQAPTGTPPATPAPVSRTDKPRIAVFNVAYVMKDFKKWQYWSNTMQNKRFDAQADLMKLRAEAQDLAKRAELEVKQAEKENLIRQAKDKQRAFEDREAVARKDLDTESAAKLKEMYDDIQRCVKAIVDSNGYDVVFAHIDATTPEEAASPMLIDMKMRPSGTVPFYVSQSIDISKVLVSTLNTNMPSPAAIPPLKGGTVPTGGTAPAGGTVVKP